MTYHDERADDRPSIVTAAALLMFLAAVLAGVSDVLVFLSDEDGPIEVAFLGLLAVIAFLFSARALLQGSRAGRVFVMVALPLYGLLHMFAGLGLLAVLTWLLAGAVIILLVSEDANRFFAGPPLPDN